MRSMSPRRPWIPIVLLLLAWFALAMVAPGAPREARAELLESSDLNYEIETPPGWTRLPADETWPKYDIVVGSIRQLDELKNGQAADGEGGLLHLAMTDAPKEKTLDDYAADPEVRGFLLKRFADDPAQWPKVKVATDKYEDGMEVRVLTTDGTSPNLKGRKSPTRAVLILAKAKGKLYKLRLYAWHSEFDAEGLKDDLDVIEMNFIIPDLREEVPKETEEGRPPEPEDEDTAPTGDAGEEKVVKDELVGWKLVKPVGIKTKDDFDKDKFGDVVAWFEDSDQVGSYQVIFYVIPRGRRNENNQQVPDPNLKEWGLDKWWAPFDNDHPDGPIHTYKWPKRSKTFLTLPDWEQEVVVFSEPRKRPKKPLDVKAKDLEKLGVAEKVKNDKLGEEKTIEAYRGVLSGNRPHFGREWVMRYIWGTSRLTCYVVVSITRDGRMKWTDKIQKLLESIEMTGRAR